MTTHLQAKPAGTPTWTDLLTPDAAASRDFYQKVFGWQFDVGGPEFGGYATARLGDRSTAGVVGDSPENAAMPSAWGLYFASNDIHADVARAVALGATLLYPAMEVGPFGSMATLTDPTGAQFSLWQAGMHVGWQMSDEPGSVTWHELYSPNAKQSRDFYTALLGATAEVMPGGMEYYVLRHGEAQLAGIMQIDPSWGAMPAQWVSYFAVANADETAAIAVANGGKQMGGIDDSPFGRIAALADANGAIFKVLQPPQR